MRFRTWLLGGVGVSVAIAVVVACGDDDVVPPPPQDAGTQADTSPPPPPPVEDAGSEASTPEAYTLDNVCEKTAQVVCDIRKPCCAATYNEAGCLAYQKAACAKDVEAVRAGTQKFHPERIDTCIPKLRALLEQCTFTWELLQSKGPDLGACAIFEGSLALDAGCERTSQCLPSTNAKDLTTCDDDSKRCKYISFLGEGAACALGDGISSVCGTGLYCDLDFATFKGFCKKSTSLGVQCDATKKPFQLECGLGNYCDPGTSKCTVGKAGGTACNNIDLECASVKCLTDAGLPDGGVCAALEPLAKPEECKGP